MRSTDFDPFVTVTGAKNQVLGWNGRTDVTNATRATLGLPPGRYNVMASSDGATGGYTVQYESNPPPNCEVLTLATGTISGVISQSDCRVLDLIAPSSDSRLADAYRLVVPVKGMYRFQVQANDLLPYLTIYAAGDIVVYRHSPISGPEEIRLLLPAGEYRIQVAANSPGPYQLTVSSTEPKVCAAAGSIPVEGTFAGALGAGDCTAGEVLSGVMSDSKIELVTLVLPERATLKVGVDSQAFPPILVLLDQNHEFVSAAFNTRYTTHTELTSTLPAGTYKIAITNPLELEGPYVLTTTSAAPTQPQ